MTANRSAGVRRERCAGSAQFRDGGFRNSRPDLATGPQPGRRGALAQEWLFGKQARRPPRPLPARDPRPVWQRPASTGLRVTWLGHSTMLLELDGLRVLTDPVWSERISPFGIAAPRRFQPVPVTLEALPPLDAIAISHDHFDHLDRATIRTLAARETPFVTPLGVGAHLEAWGVAHDRITELDWWEAVELGGLRITATPAQHFSGRVGRRNRTLWSSLVFESDRHRVFFSGDTALAPEFPAIAERFGRFDLTMLEVGGFNHAWDHVHLGPVNALDAFTQLGGGRLLPVHWGTFNLALHAWDEPIETLVPLAAARGIETLVPQLGQPFEPAHGLALEPWWRGVAPVDHAVTAAPV